MHINLVIDNLRHCCLSLIGDLFDLVAELLMSLVSCLIGSQLSLGEIGFLLIFEAYPLSLLTRISACLSLRRSSTWIDTLVSASTLLISTTVGSLIVVVDCYLQTCYSPGLHQS